MRLACGACSLYARRHDPDTRCASRHARRPAPVLRDAGRGESDGHRHVRPTFIVTAWNPAAERLFGWTRAEALGRHIDELVGQHEAIRDDAAALNDRVLDGPVEVVTRRAQEGRDARRRRDPLGADHDRRPAGGRVRAVRGRRRARASAPLLRVARRDESHGDHHGRPELRCDPVEPGRRATLRLLRRRGDRHESRRSGRERPRAARRGDRVDQRGMGHGTSFRRIGRRTRKDGSLVDVEILAIREEQEDEPSGFYILYHDVTELEQTRRRLEARVDEQMAELVRTGELARFLPRQVAEGLLEGAAAHRGGFVRAPAHHGAVRRHGRVHRPRREPGARGARRGAERLPPGDDRGGHRVRRVGRQPDRRRRDGRLRRSEGDAGGRAGMGGGPGGDGDAPALRRARDLVA